MTIDANNANESITGRRVQETQRSKSRDSAALKPTGKTIPASIGVARGSLRVSANNAGLGQDAYYI